MNGGEMPGWMKEKRKEFSGLLKEVKIPKPGTYEIEVAEVLGVGQYHLRQPEVAVVKDTQGRTWEIPEDRNHEKPGERLISRWDVERGMKLKLVVVEEDGENVVSEVIILKGSNK